MPAARSRADWQHHLSVVVVSFDCRELLRACLDSLGGERSRLDLEVIVVDNASSDGTTQMVSASFPWVRLIEAGENAGFAKANNLAIARAQGEHLLFLNPDTIVQSGALEKTVAALEAHPDVGMLGCKLVRPDGSLDHASKRGFPTPLSSLYYFTNVWRLAPRSRHLAQYTAGHMDPNEAGPVDAVNGAFMLIRREALDDVGQMDESFWLYMEDLDWCYRIWQAGWSVLYWPEVEVVHLKGGSSGSRRSWKANLAFHQSMWLFYRKHYASRYSPLVMAAVWLGIWTKLAISATRSIVARSLARA